MLLTKKEIILILNKLNDGNSGYSDDQTILSLQAKLSVMLYMASED